MVHTQKNIKIIFLAVLLINLHVLIINKFSKKIVLYRGKKMLFTGLLKQSLKSMIVAKNDKKSILIKILLCLQKRKKDLKLTNSYWICDKLFDIGDDKVRDHCHITGKYRGAAQWSCDINLKLVQKIPVIFHNLRGYE